VPRTGKSASHRRPRNCIAPAFAAHPVRGAQSVQRRSAAPGARTNGWSQARCLRRCVVRSRYAEVPDPACGAKGGSLSRAAGNRAARSPETPDARSSPSAPAHARRGRAREGRGSQPRDEAIDAVITKCDRRHEARNLPLTGLRGPSRPTVQADDQHGYAAGGVGGPRFDPCRPRGVTFSSSARRRTERAPEARSTGPLAAPRAGTPEILWISCGCTVGKQPQKFSDRRTMVCGCLLRTQQCVELDCRDWWFVPVLFLWARFSIPSSASLPARASFCWRV